MAVTDAAEQEREALNTGTKPVAEDILVLDHASRDDDVRALAVTPEAVARLWEVCQVPDYRKVSPAAHAEFALALYGYVVRAGRVESAYFV